MHINFKLNKNFATTFNKLCEKYGEEFEYLNSVHKNQLDDTEFIDHFTADNKNISDNTVDPNANQKFKDIVSLRAEKGKSRDKLLAMNKIFYEVQKEYGFQTAKEFLEDEWSGATYLNDFVTASFIPYCFSYDLTRLCTEGLFMLGDSYNNLPPKHLDTFNDDVVEYVSWNANRTSGAVGLADYIIWSYYFWKNDKASGLFWKKEDGEFIDISEKALRQSFQKICYRLNQPFLRIDQSAFTNFSVFDRNYLVELFGTKVFPNGELGITMIEGFLEHQKIFLEEFSRIKGENLFGFPVVTISLLYQDGKFVDEDFARWACEHNRKWNDSNLFISGELGILSSCCRVTNDTKQMPAFINSIGGTALSIGSVKVNTINLKRIAIESGRNQDKFMEILEKRMTLVMKVLKIIRKIITRNIEKGLLTNYVDGCIDMEKQFCTIGINAMYEAINYFKLIKTDEFGYKSYSDEGLVFAANILDKMNKLKDEFPVDYQQNIECIPGETCAKIFCKKDLLLYGEENNVPVYSNQWIPLVERCSIKEKLRLGALLDKKCGGGLR